MPSLEQIAKGAKASGLTQKDFEARILANPKYSNLSREEVAAAWSGGLKKKDQSSGLKEPGTKTESTASQSLSSTREQSTQPTLASAVGKPEVKTPTESVISSLKPSAATQLETGKGIRAAEQPKATGFERKINELKSGAYTAASNFISVQNSAAEQIATGLRAIGVSDDAANAVEMGLKDSNGGIYAPYMGELRNTIVDYNNKLAQNTKAKNAEYEMSFEEALSRGELGEALDITAGALAESLPQTAAIIGIGALTGGVGAGVYGQLSSFDSYKKQMIKDYGLPENEARQIAFGLASIEGAMDGVTGGMAKIGSKVITKSLTKKAGEEAAKGIVKKVMEQPALAFLGGMGGEAITEGITQGSQNLLLKSTVDPNINIMDGVALAMAAGAMGGGVFSTPVVVAAAVGKASDIKARNEINKKIDELSTALDNGDVPSYLSEDVRTQLDDLVKQKRELFETDLEFYDSMSTEDQAAVGEINKKISALTKDLKEGKIDASTFDAVREVAKNLIIEKKNIEERYAGKEKQQVPGAQQEGKAPIQAQPVEETGAEAAPAGGVVQEEAKPVEEAVAEEVDTKEEDSEIEFYDNKIIDLQSEIEIEKGNLKEAKAEIDQQIKDVRADKTLTPAERSEKVEDLQAQKQDIIDDLTGNIEVYKEEIKAFKSDIKKVERAKAKKLEKAKAAPVAAPTIAEPVVVDKATDKEGRKPQETQKDGNDLILKHGSPYSFDKFLLEKVGTGEGAQAFGYGLYFTESTGIAESYARKLSEDKTGMLYTIRVKDGNTKNWLPWREPVTDGYFDKLKLTEQEQNEYQEYLDADRDDYKEYFGAYGDLNNGDEYFFQGSVEAENVPNYAVYLDLADAFGQEKATDILKRSGYSGIVYNSKKGYGDAKNYVVFDPASIEIIESGKPAPKTAKAQEAATVKETKAPAGKVANSEEVASRIASSPSKARMYTAVKRAANSLKKLFPNAEYVFVDSNEEAAEYYKQNMENVPADEKGTDKGRIIQNKNNGNIEIVINTSSADATTVYHELFHAAFFKAYAQDAATAIDFADRLSKVLATGTTAEREIAKRVLAHTAKYKGKKQNVISEEFLSELAGILAADSKSITQGMAAKIANFINNIAKKMGIGPVFTEAATTKEVVDFINSFAAAAREGGNVTEKLAPKKDGKAKQPAAGNRLFNEPLKAVKSIADGYYKRAFGTERPTFEGTRTLDKERAKRISDAFDAMKHSPNDPEVAKAYKALAEETIAQYEAFLDAGYVVEINNEEPYANSQEMIDDLRKNKRIKIFSTESGFGDTPITDKQRKENPLLAKTKFKDVNGQPMLVNDLFRAVHDFFGHAELGNSFGPLGEENAWNVHARMFSPLARRAMTTETRGQNSYVNFSGVNQEADKLREKARKLREAGKFDEALEVAGQIYELTSFADQKVGLLPEEFSEVDDTDFVVTTAVFRPSSSKADKDIDINESRAGFSRPSNFPSNTASAMDFDGETFITTQSDRLATGEQVLPNGEKITLRGGFGYPAMTGYVWAASQLSKANELAGQINRQIKEKGYALISPLVMGEESHKGNYTYFSAAMSLVNSAADKKKLSNKKFLEVVKKAAEIAGVDVSSVNAKTVKENTEMLMDLFSVEGGTFQKRSSFVKALLGNTTKKGGVHKPNLPGVITSDQLADITADPFLKGLAGTGYVMSVIRVTKPVKTRETSAKEDGFAFHESYPAIIESTDSKDPGVELIVLDKAFAVQDVFPSFETTSGKVITLESVGGDVNKYHLFLGLRNIPAVTRAKVSVKPSTQEGPKLSPRSSKLNYDKKGFDANELASLPKSPMTKAKIQDVINSGTYAFLTAENPNNKKATLEENASYMAAAKEWLSKRGYKPTSIYGMYNNKENSLFVPNMSYKDAEAFRKNFKQESVAHSDALIYEDTYQERIPGENSFNANYKDPKNDYYSVFKDKEGKIFGVSTSYADEAKPLSTFESRSSKAEEASEIARNIADQYYKNRGNVDQNWMQKLSGNVYSNLVRTPEQMEALRIKETRDSKTSRQALKIRRMAENLYSLIKNSGADAAALVTEYMSGPTAENIDAIENLKNGAKILDAATEMRAFLDQMSRQLVDGPAFAALNKELKEVILGNVGSYLKTSYRFWKDKNYKITDKAIKNAAAHVYDIIRAKKMGLLVKEGKSQQEIEEFFEATKEQMFNEALQQINDYVREVEKIRSAPKFKGSGMITTGQVKIPGESFQKRKDIPAYIQELLGVEKDPQIRFIDTALALTNILYKGEMAAKMANAFGNDFFISDDVITKEDRESGLYKMVKDEYSPLNRMWVPTDIFKVINNEDIYSADTVFGQRYYDLLKLSRKSKVLYNLPTWRKNITGGWQIIMANGILNPQFIKDLANRPAFTVMGRETEEMTQLLDEMAQYGLIGGDVNANVINGVDAMYSGIIRGDYSYVDKTWNWIKNKDKKLSERYSAIDDYTKMIIYRNKRDSFAKKLYGANYDTLNQTQQERVRAAAAEETKQTTPTFSRLPPFYRALAKVPLGDFLSFKLESVRSLSMIIKTANDDIKKAMDPKLSAVQRAEYAKTGLAKIMGAAGALSLSYVIPGMIESALGFDEEETEDMKLLRPDWMSGDNLIVKKADSRGNVSVYDMTMEDTYGDVSSMIVNLSNGEFKEVAKIFSDALGVNMVVTMLFNLAEKKDQYGRPLFESYDSDMTSVFKVVKYLSKETIFPPSFYSSGRDAAYIAEQTGENVYYLFGELALKRVVIRDYQYNMGQQFYFDAVDGAEGIKKDEQYTNLTGAEYENRLAKINQIKDKYEAIVRYGNRYDNYEMIKSAKSAIKKYYGKDEERYILYGEMN